MREYLFYGHQQKGRGRSDNLSLLIILISLQNGTTVLMRAIQHRQFQFVQKLLSQPTLDINAQNKTGESALFFIQPGDKELLHMFLSDGRVDVNIRNKVRSTLY